MSKKQVKIGSQTKSRPIIDDSMPWTCNFYTKHAAELFVKSKKVDRKKIGQRTGDVVVITGGARGLGLVAVKKFLECDLHVVMGVRNVEAGEKVVSEIRQQGITSGQASYIGLDLKSLNSVRVFAQTVLEKFPKIHVLINNAGIMWTPYELTEDGYEVQFQVNYLSHFLLTNLLLPRIVETARGNSMAGRIVNISSAGHYAGTFKNFDDIETRATVYNKHAAYFDSKLAQLAHSNFLDKKLQNEGVNVNAYSLHPGAIPTDISAHVLTIPGWAKKLMRNADDGAEVILCAAVDSEFEKKGGVFIINCGVDTQNPEALDIVMQNKLWEKSCNLVGIQ